MINLVCAVGKGDSTVCVSDRHRDTSVGLGYFSLDRLTQSQTHPNTGINTMRVAFFLSASALFISLVKSFKKKTRGYKFYCICNKIV